MKKLMYALVGLCLLCGPVFGQVPVVNAVAAAAKKVAKTAPKKVNKRVVSLASGKAANTSSKLLRSQAELSAQNIATLQALNQQRVSQAMLHEKLTHAQKIALIERINKEDAAILKDLTERCNNETFAYGAALYRERNPKFLPAKEKNIPGLFATSANPARYPDISPRYFTEFIDLIPQYDDLPAQFNALVGHLSRHLLNLDRKMLQLNKLILENERNFAAVKSAADKGRCIGIRNRLNKELARHSKEAAQNMTDLVYLLNTYPNAFEASLTMLASNLDKTFQTPFTKFLRAKIKIAAPKVEAPRRRIGFTN